jgi:hypothetical protein
MWTYFNFSKFVLLSVKSCVRWQLLKYLLSRLLCAAGLACLRGSEYVTYYSLQTKVWITNILLKWKCWAYWILDISCCSCVDSRLQNQLSFSRCLSLFWNTLNFKYSGSFWERTCNFSSYCCEVTCHVTRTRLHINRNVLMCTMNAECSISVRLHSLYYGS